MIEQYLIFPGIPLFLLGIAVWLGLREFKIRSNRLGYHLGSALEVPTTIGLALAPAGHSRVLINALFLL